MNGYGKKIHKLLDIFEKFRIFIKNYDSLAIKDDLLRPFLEVRRLEKAG